MRTRPPASGSSSASIRTTRCSTRCSRSQAASHLRPSSPCGRPRRWCAAIGITTRAKRVHAPSSRRCWRSRAPPTVARGSRPSSASARPTIAGRTIAMESERMNLTEIALRPGREPTVAARPAFLTATGPVSNAEFQRHVQAIAHELVALGLKPGSKVLLRMTNSVEFAAGFLALVWIGGVPVLQNSQFGRSELEHIIGLTRPSGVLFASDDNDPATEGLAPDAWRAVVAQMLAREDPRAQPIPPHDAQRDDPAFIVFTSGTTG